MDRIFFPVDVNIGCIRSRYSNLNSITQSIPHTQQLDRSTDLGHVNGSQCRIESESHAFSRYLVDMSRGDDMKATRKRQNESAIFCRLVEDNDVFVFALYKFCRLQKIFFIPTSITVCKSENSAKLRQTWNKFMHRAAPLLLFIYRISSFNAHEQVNFPKS